MISVFEEILRTFDNAANLEYYAICLQILHNPSVQLRLRELRGVLPVENVVTVRKPGYNVNVQVGGNDEPPYQIEKTGQRTYARTAATETTYRARVNDQWRGQRFQDLRHEIHEMIDDILNRGREGLADNDLMRVVIRHDALNHAIVVPLQAAEQMNADTIMNKVENMLQSEGNVAVDDSLEDKKIYVFMIVGALRLPQGAGRKRLTQLTGLDNSIHKKSSMVQIINDDYTCMARAIGVCLAKTCIVSKEEWRTVKDVLSSNLDILIQKRKTSLKTYKNLCEKNRKDQTNLAATLCSMAEVSTDTPFTLNEVTKFEDALKVRIAVKASTLGNKFIRVHNNDHTDRPLLYLYLVDNEGVSHFHAITNITFFFSSAYFCENCLKQYNDKNVYQCETTCIVCKSSNCRKTDSAVCCRSCHMTCRSADCYKRHQERRQLSKRDDDETDLSSCERYWRCTTCKKVVDQIKRDMDSKPHECGEWFCECCKSWVKEEHLCYLFRDKPKSMSDSFIFFDFEMTQDTVAQCQRGYQAGSCPECQGKEPCIKCKRCQNCSKPWCGQHRHVPNYVVAQTACSYCFEHTLDARCSWCGSRCLDCNAFNADMGIYKHEPCQGTCGLRETIFQGDTTLDDFGQWLFQPAHKGCTVLAHNMKGYDGVFLLEYLINNSIRSSKIIYNGSKIMYMEVEKGLNIRVLDSLNFLPMNSLICPKRSD